MTRRVQTTDDTLTHEARHAYALLSQLATHSSPTQQRLLNQSAVAGELWCVMAGGAGLYRSTCHAPSRSPPTSEAGTCGCALSSSSRPHSSPRGSRPATCSQVVRHARCCYPQAVREGKSTTAVSSAITLRCWAEGGGRARTNEPAELALSRKASSLAAAEVEVVVAGALRCGPGAREQLTPPQSSVPGEHLAA